MTEHPTVETPPVLVDCVAAMARGDDRLAQLHAAYGADRHIAKWLNGGDR